MVFTCSNKSTLIKEHVGVQFCVCDLYYDEYNFKSNFQTASMHRPSTRQPLNSGLQYSGFTVRDLT